MRRPAFEAFYQRITLKISVQPFTLKETQLFISQVIKNASVSYASGSGNAPTSSTSKNPNPQHDQHDQHDQHEKSFNLNLFNPQAVELIFKRSKGMPRLITTIMEQALIYGAAHNIPIINEEVICDIEAEL